MALDLSIELIYLRSKEQHFYGILFWLKSPIFMSSCTEVEEQLDIFTSAIFNITMILRKKLFTNSKCLYFPKTLPETIFVVSEPLEMHTHAN